MFEDTSGPGRRTDKNMETMNKRPRRKHSFTSKFKVALGAAKEERKDDNGAVVALSAAGSPGPEMEEDAA